MDNILRHRQSHSAEAEQPISSVEPRKVKVRETSSAFGVTQVTQQQGPQVHHLPTDLSDNSRGVGGQAGSAGFGSSTSHHLVPLGAPQSQYSSRSVFDPSIELTLLNLPTAVTASTDEYRNPDLVESVVSPSSQQSGASTSISRSRSAENTLSEEYILQGSGPPKKLTAHSSLTDLLRVSNSASNLLSVSSGSFSSDIGISSNTQAQAHTGINTGIVGSKSLSPKQASPRSPPRSPKKFNPDNSTAHNIPKQKNTSTIRNKKKEVQTNIDKSAYHNISVGQGQGPPGSIATTSHQSHQFVSSKNSISTAKMTSNHNSTVNNKVKLSPNRPGALRYKSKTTGSVSTLDSNYSASTPPIGRYPYESRRGSEPSPPFVHTGGKSTNPKDTPFSPPQEVHTTHQHQPQQYGNGNPFEDPAIVNTFISSSPIPLKQTISDPSRLRQQNNNMSIGAATEAKLLQHHKRQSSSPILPRQQSQNLHVFDPLLNGTKDMSLYDTINKVNVKNQSGSATPTAAISSSQSSPGSRPTTATTAATMSTAHDSIVSEQLTLLAAELASLKPRKNTDQEERQLAQENHRITLGDLPMESTGTAKSHRVSKSMRSMNVEEMELVISSIHEKTDGTDGGDGGVAPASSDTKMNMNGSSRRNMHRKSSSIGSITGSSMMNLFKPTGGSDRKERDNKGLTKSLGPGPITPIKLTRSKSKSSPNKKRDGSIGRIGAGSKGNNDSPTKKELNRENSTPQSARQSIFGRRSIGTPSSPPSPDLMQSSRQNNSNIIANNSMASSISPSQTLSPEIKMRSSEQDPDPHQMNLPQITDVLFQARLCHLLEYYRTIDMNFDFGGLVGMSREEMTSFLEGGQNGPSPPISLSSTPTLLSTPKPSPLDSKSFSGSASRQQILMDVHKPILSCLMSCSDDIVLEGFFHEVEMQGDNNKRLRSPSFVDTSTDKKSSVDRMEVAVFKSDYNRQFVVVCQGSSELQAKPIKKIAGVVVTPNLSRRNEPEANFTPDASSIKDNDVAIFPAFMKAYKSKFSDLEDQLIKRLDELAEEHPFFDVIVTGHSFGGILAQLASLRYACLRPNLFVSCYNFGCPKIGALNYRYYVHSLPNLKVMRMEYGCDPWINEPSQPVWVHAGHCIVIESGNKAGKSNNDDSNSTNTAKAYRFGSSRPTLPGSDKNKFIRGLSRPGSKQGSKQERQTDHEISSYIGALERMMKSKTAWPTDYEGSDGVGVSGSNQEKRLMV